MYLCFLTKSYARPSHFLIVPLSLFFDIATTRVTKQPRIKPQQSSSHPDLALFQNLISRLGIKIASDTTEPQLQPLVCQGYLVH